VLRGRPSFPGALRPGAAGRPYPLPSPFELAGGSGGASLRGLLPRPARALAAGLRRRPAGAPARGLLPPSARSPHSTSTAWSSLSSTWVRRSVSSPLAGLPDLPAGSDAFFHTASSSRRMAESTARSVGPTTVSRHEHPSGEAGRAAPSPAFLSAGA